MAIVLNGTTGITNDGGYTGDGVVFADTTPANTLVTTTGGNVGVGTSSPVARIHAVTLGAYNGTASSRTGLHIQSSNISGGFANGRIQFSFDSNAPKAYIEAGVYGADYLAFSKGDGSGEAARFDSSGNLLVGTTAQFNSCKQGLIFDGATNIGFAVKNSNAATGQVFVGFYNSAGTNIGTITQNATTTVAYNTSSDYRLKENIVPMTGALSKVALLKPVTYSWKQEFGGEDGQGFIAHELQEVVPDCVTGAKDAVDAEGNPRYQGIDTSFLVATLAAAIQEQQAMIVQLQADVAALKGTA